MTASGVRFVGIQPRFPGFLNRWKCLTAPIAAERVAALRIATALALLFDIGFGLLPHFTMFFSAESLGGRDLYPSRFREGHYYWSSLRVLPASWGPTALFAIWITAAVGLLVGYRPLVTGLICWACSVSVWNINPGINNGGDQLRNSLLFLVSFCRSGAVLGVQSVRRAHEPVFVPSWPVTVLIVQLACVYFFSGVYKLLEPAWRSGFVMYFVNHDLVWSLTPSLSSRLPVEVHRLTAWATIAWELAFPLLIAFKGLRAVTLWIGVLFHVLSFFTLEVGHFAVYALAWYPMFVPWERLTERRRDRAK